MSTIEDRIRALALWRGALHLEPLSGGLSNLSFVARDAEKKLVVRVGRDLPFHHVQREREVMVTRAAHQAGFAPELVHAEPGIMVSRFIDGITFDAAGVRAALPRVADLLAEFHRRMPALVRGPAFLFWPFHVIRDYARCLREGGSPHQRRLDAFLALAGELEAVQTPLPIVFGHHDLLPANFIDDGDRLWLIDFEYAGFGTAMFDLAGLSSNAGCSPEESLALLTTYLGVVPAPELLRAHAAMQCASLLREALWSMVSELHMRTPGVDYAAYTRDNLVALDGAVSHYRCRFG